MNFKIGICVIGLLGLFSCSSVQKNEQEVRAPNQVVDIGGKENSNIENQKLKSTCLDKEKSVFICHDKEGRQYDVCQFSKNKYRIKINGEVYALKSSKTVTDNVTAFEGKNYIGTKFIFEHQSKNNVTLTEINNYDMPLEEAVTLRCQ